MGLGVDIITDKRADSLISVDRFIVALTVVLLLILSLLSLTAAETNVSNATFYLNVGTIVPNITNNTIQEILWPNSTTNFSHENISMNVSAETNITNHLNITGGNESGQFYEYTSHSAIRIGEKVRWKRHVLLSGRLDALLVFPQSEKITVKKLQNGSFQDYDERIAVNGIRTRVSRIESRLGVLEHDDIRIGLEDEEGEFIFEYYTEAPRINEEVSGLNKKITVSAPDELNYTNITSFTNIPEILSVGQEDNIRLYWVENKSYIFFNASDTDGNGLLDYVEWIVPHLSNQTFEISILVLNIQSYPTLGGRWSVAFQTNGKANLTIIPVEDTEFERDLRFLEVRCGDEVLDVDYNGRRIFIEDFECNTTAKETSQVLTPRKHALKFIFGSQEAYAYNDVIQWWNTSYLKRRQLNVTTGASTPDSGFMNYTVRFSINTSGSDFQDDCEDLRIVFWNGTNNELHREVINCGTESTDVRFRLQRNVSASSTDAYYFVYYSNSTVSNPPDDKSLVYLWYDDASSNRESEYVEGLFDESAHGGAWGNTVAWQQGNYSFDTGDNYVDSMRPRGFSERDIYVEYEEYQTNAYATDMTSGPAVRWVGTGSGASESSSHWYYYEMADSTYMTGSYASHDDITADTRSSVVVAYGLLGDFPRTTWIRLGIAAWGANPTNLKTYYNNESGGWNGYRFSGQHASGSDNELAGQFGVWLQQDAGVIRNILARKYTEPEPTISLNPEEDLDLKLPVVLLISPGNDAWSTTGNIEFRYNATDINLINCTLYGNFSGQWQANETNTTVASGVEDSFSLNLEDGHYLWNVLCYDLYGNSAFNSTNYTVHVDTVKPSIFLNWPDDNYNFSTDSVNFNWTAVDNLDRNMSCDLTIDGAVNVSGIPSLNNTPANQTVVFDDGSHSWSIACWDDAGNVNSTVSRDFLIDTSFPEITLDYPGNDTWLNFSSIEFNYTPADENLEACELWGNFSGQWQWNSTESSPLSGSINTFGPLVIDEGIFIWNILCNDSAGNPNWSSSNYTFYIDTILPAINFTSPTPGNNANQTSSILTINVTHNDTNPDTIILYIDGSENYTGSYSGNYTNFTLQLDDGAHTYYAWINDTASNHNQTEQRSIDVDTTPPSLQLGEPQNDTWQVNNTVYFQYTASDNYMGIENCSLIIGGKINQTNNTVSEGSLQNFSLVLDDTMGISWSINCSDKLGNTNGSETRIVKVDTTSPQISNEDINGTEFNINNFVCLNATITDSFSDVQSVIATVDLPLSGLMNYSFSNVSGCGSPGGSTWTRAILLIEAGEYNWTVLYGIDKAGNINESLLKTLKNWSVSAEMFLNSTMPIPAVNFKLNESTEQRNESFLQTCNVTCRPDSTGTCEDVYIYAQYKDAFWEDTTNSTVVFINSLGNYSCGDISIGGYCNYTFNITVGTEAGGSKYGIRCRAFSSTAAADYSDSINLTINDFPVAAFTYPSPGSWLHAVEVLNASASTDDFSIVQYSFELDNNTEFNSSTVLCQGSDENCSFDTTLQTQCIEESIECYLRLNVTDNDGLKNSTYINIGIDNIGPSSLLYRPANKTNITSDSYSVNATVDEYGSGLSHVVFEYRENLSESWKSACIDDDQAEPYQCTWDLAGIPDGSDFQFRVFANDTLGNTGSTDMRENITVDRLGPLINLELPNNDTWSQENVTFYYNVTDWTSDVEDCSLLFDSQLNQTNFTITESESQNFSLYNIDDGTHTWQIRCFDEHGNENLSEERTIKIDSTAPVSTLYRPQNKTNISAASYTVNATVSDSFGIGINATIFYYRENSTDSWKLICVDSISPYSCSWNTGILPEGNFYEVRVHSNDSQGLNGSFDVHGNITLDRTGPEISLESPENETLDLDGQMLFEYNATDTHLDIANCSLLINGTINITEYAVQEAASQSFQQNFTNGTYVWSVNCSDNAGNTNVSENRTFIVAPDEDFPQIELILPGNNSVRTSPDIYFVYNVTDATSGIANCSLYINETLNTSVSNPQEGQENSFLVQDMADGSYSWYINCTDDSPFLNTNYSETRFFNISQAAEMSVNITVNNTVPEQGEELLFGINTTDVFDNPINTSITIDIIRANTTASWYDDSWKLRKRIAIDKDQIIGNLTDFPFLIDIYDSSLHDYAQQNGNDILFADIHGMKLSHEIELFNQTYNSSHAHLVAWVKTDLSHAEDEIIYIYYNNSGASSQQNAADVWSSNYLAVWHLAESPDGTADGIKDSSGNSRHLTSSGMSSGNLVDGRAGKAHDFEGDEDYLEDSDGENYINGLSQVTVEMWVESDTVATDRGFMNGEPPDGGDNVFTLRYDDAGATGGQDDVLKGAFSSTSGEQQIESSASAQTTSWQHLAFMWMSGHYISLFIDGQNDTSTANSAPLSGTTATANTLIFGQGAKDTGGSDGWDGKMDEIRISSVTRTPEWINTSYNNQYSPGSFITLGEEEEIIFTASQDTGIFGYYSFVWNTGNKTPGNYSAVVLSVNDDYNNATDVVSFEIYADSTPPLWSSLSYYPSSPAVYDGSIVYQFNITWTDLSGIYNVFMENDFDGSLANFSVGDFSGDEYYYNYTTLSPGNYSWRFYGNDSGALINQTAVFYFLVINNTVNITENITIDEDVEIDWSPVDFADNYSIYYTDDLDNDFSILQTGITDSNWTDPGADSVPERYYLIAANVNGTEINTTKIIGKKDYYSDNNWSLISVPFNISDWILKNSTYDGFNPHTEPDNCLVSIYRYNITGDCFAQTDIMGDEWYPASGCDGFTDNSLEPSRGYWFFSNETCRIIFSGEVTDTETVVNYQLDTDYNIVGWYSPVNATLPTGGEPPYYPVEVDPVDSVWLAIRYDDDTQTFQHTGHYDGWGWWPYLGSEDFVSLESMRSYYFVSDNPATWTYDTR